MGWSDWAREVEVEPSLFSADLSRLGEQVAELLDAGVHVFHFDVGDGHFIDLITMGSSVLQWITERIHRTGAAVDVHLMVEDPASYFEPFAKVGGDSVTFHFEAVDDVAAAIAAARRQSLGVGIAFNPETDPADLARTAGDADVVLCMAIDPGSSEHPFPERTYDRVRELRALLPPEVRIQVEGGVGAENIVALRDAGASLFVAASSIFGAGDPGSAYRDLDRAVR